jgi:hypothetical protein
VLALLCYAHRGTVVLALTCPTWSRRARCAHLPLGRRGRPALPLCPLPTTCFTKCLKWVTLSIWRRDDCIETNQTTKHTLVLARLRQYRQPNNRRLAWWEHAKARHDTGTTLSDMVALPCRAVLCHRAHVAAQAWHYGSLTMTCRVAGHVGHRAAGLHCRHRRAPSCAPPPRMRRHRHAPPQGLR